MFDQDNIFDLTSCGKNDQNKHNMRKLLIVPFFNLKISHIIVVIRAQNVPILKIFRNETFLVIRCPTLATRRINNIFL